MIDINNTYSDLPSEFYHRVKPSASINPELISLNTELASFLNIDTKDKKLFTNIFSGKSIKRGSKPLAMVYAGHQFGNFVPRLGDGRAILIGEVKGKNNLLYDLHLKGSGKTMYSRNGDGRCPIGPAIREYLVSEAVHSLKIPTTRSLAIFSTGEKVYRETDLPGAILVRVASSHIRVGTFEYFSYKKDFKNLKVLADYSIKRHFPNLIRRKDKYFIFFSEVVIRQLKLVSKWLSFGFIHGVMNTDNTLISGETIDYGPCAFMDHFKKNKVFSSIDYGGRYSFNNQSFICFWNMLCFANAILPLFDNTKSAAKILELELSNFKKKFTDQWTTDMSLKFGSKKNKIFDENFFKSWTELLESENLDYTNSFLKLEEILLLNKNGNKYIKQTNKIYIFAEKWIKILKANSITLDSALKTMRENNPYYIPRNHIVERVINEGVKGNFNKLEEFYKMIKDPFKKKKGFKPSEQEPKEDEKVFSTFCGT